MSQRVQPLLQKGLALQEKGELDAAWSFYQKALTAAPGAADAWYLSGLIAIARGQHDEAIRLIRRATELHPGQPFFHLNLGNALQASGALIDAEAAFRRSIALAPGLAAAHHNLGNLLVQCQREDEAIAAFDRTLVLEPTHFRAQLTLAGILFRRRLTGPALTLVQRALAQRADDAEALNLMAAIMQDLGRFDLSLNLLDRLLTQQPDDPLALANRSTALSMLNRFRDAIDAARRSLLADPGNVIAAGSLTAALTQVGQPDQGTEVLESFFARWPGQSYLYSQYLFQLNYAFDRSPAAVFDRHRQWDQRNQSAPRWTHHDTPAAAGRRLRIGYVSPDLKVHSVAFFLEPLLDQHDRRRFEILAYSNTPWPDETSARLTPKFDLWRDIRGLDSVAIAERVAADQVDILIDLAGHTGGNSLQAFALKPAPVQISWLGYPNTTGVAAIDFRISDAVADPPGVGDGWNSETVLRLPDCFHCYRPGSDDAFDPQPPSAKSGRITFSSFNILAKISDPTLHAWRQILDAVPGSELLLKTLGLSDPYSADLLTERLQRCGIDPARVRPHPFTKGHQAHMASYRQVDIALDTFPYNGTTTTCDALWMGVPVVTYLGDRHAARVSASLLGAIGMNELVADSIDGYVALAIALATDADRLARLHAGLRPLMQRSPLVDAPRFARNFEALLERAWQLKVTGKSPS